MRRAHRRNELVHDDVLRWRYILEQHQGELQLTREEHKLLLDCCQGWIDNFYPPTPDGSFFFPPPMTCAMASFAVQILFEVDEMTVYDERGRQHRQQCCPAAAIVTLPMMTEDRAFHGRRVRGLRRVKSDFTRLRPALRFELLFWFYSKATHDEMRDEHGEPFPTLFADSHVEYGLQTYDTPAHECRVCPCHGSYFPFMGRPPRHFEPEAETQ